VDHFQNRRVPWYVGLLLIIAGTVVFGVADKFWTFVLSRLLQGISSAILYTVGLAVLVETVNKDEVGRYMGTAMSCNNFGIILSPLIGGIFYEAAGKYAVFGLMAGLSAIDITLRLLMRENPTTIPFQGKITYMGETKKAPTSSSSHLTAITRSEVANPSTEKLCVIVQPAPQGRLAGIFQLVRSPRLLTALYGCFVNECIVASLCAVLPLFVNQTFHWTSLQAGCLFLAIAIPGLAGPLAGLLADKVGARWVAVSGFLLTAPFLVLMSLVKTDSLHDIVVLCVLLSLAGSSIIFFLSPLGADLSVVADTISAETGMDMYASAFSLMNSALAAASIIGPLFIGWLQKEVGWTGTCVAMGVMCFSGALPCVSFSRFLEFSCCSIVWVFSNKCFRHCSRGEKSQQDRQLRQHVRKKL
jgi:MFS family permease